MLKKYVIIALCALNMAGTASSMSYFRRFTAPISASIALYSANYFGSKPAKSEESPEIAKLISRSDSSLWYLTQSRAGGLKSSEWIKSLSEYGAKVHTQSYRKFTNSWSSAKETEGDVNGVCKSEYELTNTGNGVSIDASTVVAFSGPTASRRIGFVRKIFSNNGQDSDEWPYMKCTSSLDKIVDNEKTGRSSVRIFTKCSGSVPKNVLEWAVLNPEKIATPQDQESVEVLE